MADSQSRGLASISLLQCINPIPTLEAIFQERASPQAEDGRCLLRFAFQVAAPSRLFHITAGWYSLSFSPPGRFCPLSPVESRPAGVHRGKRERESRRTCPDCCSAFPARGMSGRGPTAPGATRQGSPPSARLSACLRGNERAAGWTLPPVSPFSSDRGKASAGGGSSRSLWK